MGCIYFTCDAKRGQVIRSLSTGISELVIESAGRLRTFQGHRMMCVSGLDVCVLHIKSCFSASFVHLTLTKGIFSYWFGVVICLAGSCMRSLTR